MRFATIATSSWFVCHGDHFFTGSSSSKWWGEAVASNKRPAAASVGRRLLRPEPLSARLLVRTFLQPLREVLLGQSAD